MKRRNDEDGSPAFWILALAFLLGVVLIAHGEANTDAGAELCPRSSHFCVELQ